MTYLHTIDGNKVVLANYARDCILLYILIVFNELSEAWS